MKINSEMEKLTQPTCRIYIGEWRKKMAGSSIFFIKVFQFIAWDSTWLYVCGSMCTRREIHCKMYDSFVTRTPINESLTHTGTKLAGGWLGWIHDEVQAINFIWVSPKLSSTTFWNICTHTDTWRQTDAHSRRHTHSHSLSVSLDGISRIYFCLLINQIYPYPHRFCWSIPNDLRLRLFDVVFHVCVYI